MQQNNRTLQILMNGFLVGTLEKKAKGDVSFSYDQKWINAPLSRPISLSLPLQEQPLLGDPVYHFFDNLLPDNPQIRAQIQSRFKIKTNHPFDLLACIGRDCVGAIQIEENPLLFVKGIKCESIDEKKIAHILRGYQSPLGYSEENLDIFRISIAGAQEKTAFLYHNQGWNIPLGQTPTTHIFKLPIGFIPHQQIDLKESCENEWLCLKIAAAFGLPTAKGEILSFEDIKILSVERFDRQLSADKTWFMRLPQEDMCQALGLSSNMKYQSDGGPGIHAIMQLLLGSENPDFDRDFFYRTQVLFWLLAAIDGHAKNYSVFIKPQGNFCLTPLYDILSAYPLMATGQLHPQKIKMAMALKGKNQHYHWDRIQYRHFIETAKAAHYPSEKAKNILNTMLEQVEAVIEQISSEIPRTFPQHICNPIFEGMRAMKKRLIQSQCSD